jgi:hypothetical protein
MKKVKWLRFKSELPYERVLAGLNAMKFSSDVADGFQVIRSRNDFIEARYIEKIEYNEAFRDPFGVEVVSRHVVYKQQEFSIYFEREVIEILNPARSLVSFLTRLGEACSFECYVEPIAIDLGSVQAKFEFAKGFFVNKSVTVSDLDLGGGVVAKVVANGAGCIDEVLLGIVRKRPHRLASISYVSNSSEIRASYSLSKDATLRASGRDASKVIECFREFLNGELI